MPCSLTKCLSRSAGSPWPAERDRWRRGLPYCRANSAVTFEPPVSPPDREKITVPSESLTFHSVRCE